MENSEPGNDDINEEVVGSVSANPGIGEAPDISAEVTTEDEPAEIVESTLADTTAGSSADLPQDEIEPAEAPTPASENDEKSVKEEEPSVEPALETINEPDQEPDVPEIEAVEQAQEDTKDKSNGAGEKLVDNVSEEAAEPIIEEAALELAEGLSQEPLEDESQDATEKVVTEPSGENLGDASDSHQDVIEQQVVAEVAPDLEDEPTTGIGRTEDPGVDATEGSEAVVESSEDTTKSSSPDPTAEEASSADVPPPTEEEAVLPTEATAQQEVSVDTAQAEVVPAEVSEISYNLEEYQSGAKTKEDSGIPLNLLDFFHSFGYDCRKRANLHLLSGPTLLFAAGNLVHLLDLSDGSHRFLRSCSGGGIGALTVHSSFKYFAVAEKGAKPHILIYTFPELKLHRVLRGGTEAAYSFIDFDPSGEMLASVGSAPDYMLTVWNWVEETVMLRSKAFSQEVYRVTFSPEQEGQLASSGISHIRFWKMATTFTGLKLKGDLGRFGKTSISDIEGYIQLPDGKVLSGSEWGNMLLWDGGLIKVEISRKGGKPCHVGSVQQLVLDEGELITIGLDGFVRVWEMEAIDTADATEESNIFEIEPMNELKVDSHVELTSMVKSNQELEPSLEEGDAIWYAQDANGGIWKLDLSFSHTTKPPEKLCSFVAGGITGVGTSPQSHLVAITGDTYVRVYDYLTCQPVCNFKAPIAASKGTSLLWLNKVVDPKGTTVVAGFSDGILRVLNLGIVDGENTLTLKSVSKPHASDVTAIACDNTGEFLATGSTDNTVFFFAITSDGFEPVGFVPTSGPVASLQWAPPGFTENALLVTCSNGVVMEIVLPSTSEIDTGNSYKLNNATTRHYKFKSIKSRLRRDEERARKEEARKERREKREKELKKRKARGDEISDEEAAAFLDNDPEAEEEAEEEPLFFPASVTINQAFYLTPGRFIVSMGDYDAGYLYECKFSDAGYNNPDVEAEEATRTVAVEDSADVPISYMGFTADRRKFLTGFQNGVLRVYPLDDDPEMVFDIDMMQGYFEMNMHDNNYGSVKMMSESFDGAYLFSAGADGNMFGYHSLAHDEIIKSMAGQRAKLPTPKRSSPDDKIQDDIDDPNAYSIEDAKLKAENDKMMREAEAKKMAERRRISKLRKTFLELLQKNDELPESVKLQRSEFELDPTLREKMNKQTESKIERVRLEMQFDKAKLQLAHNKIQNRFRSHIECDRIVVHSFNSSHTVASYRIAKFTDEYLHNKEVIEERVRLSSLAAEGGLGSLLDGHSVLNTERTQGSGEHDVDETFISETQQKKKASILVGRQAEKVAKALKKAEEAKLKREKRQKEWNDLLKSKPDENYEDPADVAAIKEAQANMGDFKLKTAPDYVVPEHLRIDTEKKRMQMLVLQGLIYEAKAGYNGLLLNLRDSKLDLIETVATCTKELIEVQSKLSRNDRKTIPAIPRPHDDEQPLKCFEYTTDDLLKFETEAAARQAAESKKAQQGGDGGLFGGFGGDDDKEDEGSTPVPQVIEVDDSSTEGETSEGSDVKSSGGTALEQQLAQIETIRLKYQQDRLLRIINDKKVAFDAELRLLRHKKGKMDIDIKMADLRLVTLLEELLLLKEYEKRETALLSRVGGKRSELADINGKAVELQGKLEAKRRDIDRLQDREKALIASFQASLGENNKFADFLMKVFKKKIKRAKKKVLKEGEEEDSDEESDSDESDWSSDEDEDDDEGGLDDSVCPPGCDESLFDSACQLREKKLDLEEALVDEKKIAETLKKDTDATLKKAKIMEAQLKSALADHEAFQVEKQGKLNELDVVVPLRLNQVEHVINASVPSDLSQCLVFGNASLAALQRRIKELQAEKSEQRKFYKEARQQHVHLIKSRKTMEERTQVLEEKCENMMMLKFGRIVDLEKLETVTVNRNIEELKEQVRRQESKNAREASRGQKKIDELKDQIIHLTRANTARLERLNVLINDKGNLEEELDKRQKNMELEQTGRKKADVREQHRLVQLVQLQAQEIQALKEEIGLLSRKGGHILPPAQPPLGQETE